MSWASGATKRLGKKAAMVKTVLIADDEEDIRAVIGMRLHKFHYRVLHATNGAQAIELAIKEFPDLLVLDWTLPGMNGA
ncbi:MAG: response regulator, partial [Nitrospiraceae bacterium]